MSRNRFMMFLALLVVASMLLAACGSTSTTPANSSTLIPGDSVPASALPGTSNADTIIVGAWQQPGTYYDPAFICAKPCACGG
jgi:ABC-type oligopeptide transport system substrate-binding subunit